MMEIVGVLGGIELAGDESVQLLSLAEHF